MGLFNRAYNTLVAKVNKLIEKIEDPREELDLSYEKQLDLLQEVKRGITDLVTAKVGLEQEKHRLCILHEELDGQARYLVKQKKEDLAKVVIERKVNTKNEIDSLTAQIEKLNVDKAKLIEKAQALEHKVDEFRSQKETLKARYNAAQASVRVNESVTGIGNKIGDAGDAIRKIKDRTMVMTDRSMAIEELSEDGILDDGLGGTKIERELKKSRVDAAVEEELEAMKKSIK